MRWVVLSRRTARTSGVYTSTRPTLTEIRPRSSSPQTETRVCGSLPLIVWTTPKLVVRSIVFHLLRSSAHGGEEALQSRQNWCKSYLGQAAAQCPGHLDLAERRPGRFLPQIRKSSGWDKECAQNRSQTDDAAPSGPDSAGQETRPISDRAGILPTARKGSGSPADGKVKFQAATDSRPGCRSAKPNAPAIILNCCGPPVGLNQPMRLGPRW